MTVIKNNDQHTISLLVNNKPGVLIRIALVFSRRGFNIDSCVVSPAKEARFSRMTITASGDIRTLEQIIKQLNKLVDAQHATDHTGDASVERELTLVKVKCGTSERTEVMQIAEHFKAQSLDITDGSMMLECTGRSEKLDAFLLMLSKFGIIEVVRTGKVLMARGREET